MSGGSLGSKLFERLSLNFDLHWHLLIPSKANAI
jgi:hypothetical protein